MSAVTVTVDVNVDVNNQADGNSHRFQPLGEHDHVWAGYWKIHTACGGDGGDGGMSEVKHFHIMHHGNHNDRVFQSGSWTGRELGRCSSATSSMWSGPALGPYWDSFGLLFAEAWKDKWCVNKVEFYIHDRASGEHVRTYFWHGGYPGVWIDNGWHCFYWDSYTDYRDGGRVVLLGAGQGRHRPLTPRPDGEPSTIAPADDPSPTAPGDEPSTAVQPDSDEPSPSQDVR